MAYEGIPEYPKRSDRINIEPKLCKSLEAHIKELNLEEDKWLSRYAIDLFNTGIRRVINGMIANGELVPMARVRDELMKIPDRLQSNR